MKLVARLNWLVPGFNRVIEFDFLVMDLSHIHFLARVGHPPTRASRSLLLVGRRTGPALLDEQLVVIKSTRRSDHQRASQLTYGSLVCSQFTSELLYLRQIPLLRCRIFYESFKLALHSSHSILEKFIFSFQRIQLWIISSLVLL